MKTDILAFGAHPDDIELGCSGVLIAAAKQGKKTAIADLTRGELGTRGTAETRKNEALHSAKILKIVARENLEMQDGFFQINDINILKVIRVIRKYQPEIVLCNAPEDRHPDHGRASQLIVEAAFLSGLMKIETSENNVVQEAWRPKQVFHYIQSSYINPDFIVDISDEFDEKLQSILAFNTQFNVKDGGPQTYISDPDFIKFIEARAITFGRRIGVKYGEGFISEKSLGIQSFDSLLL